MKNKNYQFLVKETDNHDEEVAVIEAKDLKEAKKIFIKTYPEDEKNIEIITSDNGYEEIK